MLFDFIDNLDWKSNSTKVALMGKIPESRVGLLNAVLGVNSAIMQMSLLDKKREDFEDDHVFYMGKFILTSFENDKLYKIISDFVFDHFSIIPSDLRQNTPEKYLRVYLTLMFCLRMLKTTKKIPEDFQDRYGNYLSTLYAGESAIYAKENNTNPFSDDSK